MCGSKEKLKIAEYYELQKLILTSQLRLITSS